MAASIAESLIHFNESLRIFSTNVPGSVEKPEVYEFLINFTVACVYGLVLGFQREIDSNPAGTKTHSLVALGACAFTLMSRFELPGTDPARMVANIITGIGFIGAGTIIKRGGGISGLTTAASLWTSAALGAACGLDAYWIGAFLLAFSTGVLSAVKFLQDYIWRTKKRKVFVFKNYSVAEMGPVLQYLTEKGVVIKAVRRRDNLREVVVRFAKEVTLGHILGGLLAAAGTAEFEREGKESRIYFQKEDSMTATQSMYQSRPRDEDNNIDKVTTSSSSS